MAGRILSGAGYRVLAADGGPQALELAARHEGAIDLLVSDVVMPGMLGKDLAERLVDVRPDTRVLYMSGYAQPVLASQGTLDPGVVLLEKPFTADGPAAAPSRRPTRRRIRSCADAETRRRIGIMGGTFDPIHHGHLVAASEVADRFDLDEVVFVPTGEPWQKGTVSPAEDRYLMTVIATASNPRFHVSRADIDRDGPTYTVDTLRDLHAVYGPAATCSSSPAPTRWRGSSRGRTPTRSSRWPTSSG